MKPKKTKNGSDIREGKRERTIISFSDDKGNALNKGLPNKKTIKEINRPYAIRLEDALRIIKAEGKLKRIENSRKKTAKKGAAITNKNKKHTIEERQSKIKAYLTHNPNPKLGAYSLAGFLIKTLKLRKSNGKEPSEKTINRDIEQINLDKR